MEREHQLGSDHVLRGRLEGRSGRVAGTGAQPPRPSTRRGHSGGLRGRARDREERAVSAGRARVRHRHIQPPVRRAVSSRAPQRPPGGWDGGVDRRAHARRCPRVREALLPARADDLAGRRRSRACGFGQAPRRPHAFTTGGGARLRSNPGQAAAPIQGSPGRRSQEQARSDQGESSLGAARGDHRLASPERIRHGRLLRSVPGQDDHAGERPGRCARSRSGRRWLGNRPGPVGLHAARPRSPAGREGPCPVSRAHDG